VKRGVPSGTSGRRSPAASLDDCASAEVAGAAGCLNRPAQDASASRGEVGQMWSHMLPTASKAQVRADEAVAGAARSENASH
jgi:hypothetical protein